jgi:ribosomal protein S18 acetylase RimI-like enzyme|tara:strand:- start:1420 stop:1917 length:498 start_codon:yes stop_codon:yes gene_type:complete
MEDYKFLIAGKEHFDDFYKLKSEPNNIFWSGFSKAPDYEAFQAHFTAQLERTDRTIVFLYFGEKIAGYIAIDFCQNEKTTETAHGVLTDFAGKRLGQKLIEHAVSFSKSHHPDATHIIGWIAEDNYGSIKNVMNNGYSKTEESELRFFEQNNQNVKFEKYILSLK